MTSDGKEKTFVMYKMEDCGVEKKKKDLSFADKSIFHSLLPPFSLSLCF